MKSNKMQYQMEIVDFFYSAFLISKKNQIKSMKKFRFQGSGIRDQGSGGKGQRGKSRGKRSRIKDQDHCQIKYRSG